MNFSLKTAKFHFLTNKPITSLKLLLLMMNNMLRQAEWPFDRISVDRLGAICNAFKKNAAAVMS
jgi:hypothetical protein